MFSHWSWAVVWLVLLPATGMAQLLGQGGTPLCPEATGTPRSGAFAGVGLGVDNVR
ncbi:hypothetical protein LY474_10810 [Myxococcus stipitatus]|uniref:hypothetical protein n=1 Tax=Myxococcus stipitatus TaxID=83455 RepID=UPI001F36848E|nr:hypothetical protein [Myxococcus stipitatus]MCE9668303.1 hypothetical protein [Myxococcus stipitatus]